MANRYPYLTILGMAFLVITVFTTTAWAVPPYINYQGQLTDSATGDPITDPGLSMTFRIYDAATGGTALWEEEHSSVPVANGIYNVLLGAGTTTVGTFDPSLFSADNRWLEVEIEYEIFDPRQEVTSVAYAFTAATAGDADTLDGHDSLYFAEEGHKHPFSDITGTATDAQIPNDITINYAATAGSATTASHATTADSATTAGYATTAGNADTVDNKHAAEFAGAIHTHSGADIITGTIADARIASTIARDSEIMPTVLANDGTGSTLNADYLDGLSESSFFRLSQSETVSGRPYLYGGTSGSTPPFYVDSTYLVTNLNADYLDGHQGSAYTRTTQDYGRSGVSSTLYEGTATLTSKYVNVTGDDMTGNLSVKAYSYGKGAVRGTDQSGSSIFAEGQLGVLSPTGLPYNPVNIGVLGIKPNLGGNGVAVYGWNNDSNPANYGMYAVANGSGTTNYGIYAKAANASVNYAGYFDGTVRIDGEADFYDTSGDSTLLMEASEDGTLPGAQIKLENGSDKTTVELDGYIWGGGALYLRNKDGATTIRLEGDYGNSTDGRIITQELQITGGSDLSEQFDIEKLYEDIKPGMLVSIDPKKPGKLQISVEPYDKKVAGIISGANGIKPGMLMGQQGTDADGAYPVALTGRVYCWANTSNGPIEAGDLLTTSHVPGHAMKATDRDRAFGATIGKAMTSLEQGGGLVLVLVSLQ